MGFPKRRFIFCLILTFAGFIPFAISAPPVAQRTPTGVFRDLQSALDELNLNPDQKTRTGAIMQESLAQFESLKEAAEVSSVLERLEMLRKLYTSTQTKIGAELNNQQRVAFLEKVRQRRPRGESMVPATQPAEMPRGRFGPDALAESLKELDLTTEQRTKLQSILADSARKMQERRNAGDREGIREAMQDGREKIALVLTPDQQTQLRDLMQKRATERLADNRPKPEAPAAPKMESKPDAKPQIAPETKPETKPEPKPEQKPEMKPEMKPEPKPEVVAKKNDPPKPVEPPKPEPKRESAINSVPGPGDPAPDFKLQKLDGSTVQLSAFRGRVLVICFGSYSTPSFRDRIAPLESLKRQVGTAANFLLVYTKEAHPVGGWEVERNKDEKVSVSQHANMNERIAQARATRDKFNITIPIALDTMDDTMIKAFGGFPNGTIIVGRDGKIVARQTWTDPTGLVRLIDEAKLTKVPPPATQPAK